MTGTTERQTEAQDDPASPDIDALVVRSVARWSLLVTLAIALLDLAIVASWPFPSFIDALRGPFYVLALLAALLATAFLTLAGYRFLTLGVERRTRVLFVIFLPATFLIASAIGFLLLTAPR